MSRRTILIILSAAVAALAIAGTVVWLNATSYDDTVAACKKALTAQMKAGGEGKPSACKDVKQDDYDEIVVANVIDGMSKKDRDMLDYYDNGTIDGSIG
jgi:uncharacterized protein (UPF0333 family)